MAALTSPRAAAAAINVLSAKHVVLVGDKGQEVRVPIRLPPSVPAAWKRAKLAAVRFSGKAAQFSGKAAAAGLTGDDVWGGAASPHAVVGGQGQAQLPGRAEEVEQGVVGHQHVAAGGKQGQGGGGGAGVGGEEGRGREASTSSSGAVQGQPFKGYRRFQEQQRSGDSSVCQHGEHGSTRRSAGQGRRSPLVLAPGGPRGGRSLRPLRLHRVGSFQRGFHQRGGGPWGAGCE